MAPSDCWDGATGSGATNFSILSSALACRLIFRFKDSRRNRFADFRARPPCQNGGVVLKMTADNERIRRERELIHALELRSRARARLSSPAMKAGVAIKVAGWDIRFYTFDLDSRQH